VPLSGRRVAALRRVSGRLRRMPLERALVPGAFLAGPALCMLLWALVPLDYRASCWLEVSAGARSGEGVRLVADHVAGREFQKTWKELAASLGLGGARELSALVEEVPGEGPAGRIQQVRLVGRGRPESRLVRALVRATENLKAAHLELAPVDFEKRRKLLENDIEELEKAVAKIESQRAMSRASGEEQKLEAQALAEERSLAEEQRGLMAARQERKKLLDRLAGLRRSEPDEALRAGLAKLKSEPARKLSAQEKARIEDEIRRVRALLRGTDVEDCSSEHPLLVRWAGLKARIREGQAPAEIARIEKELAARKAIETQVAAREQEIAAAGDRITAIEARIKECREKLEKLPGRGAGLEAELTELRLRKAEKTQALRDLEAEKPDPVRVTGASNPSSEMPLAVLGWGFLAVGVAVGLFSAHLARRRLAPKTAVIRDELTLADTLGMQVLGTVPRLHSLRG